MTMSLYLLHMVVAQAGKERKACPALRKGQSLFNALHDLNPELANSIRCGDIDPFYDDSRISLFLDWLDKARH